MNVWHALANTEATVWPFFLKDNHWSFCSTFSLTLDIDLTRGCWILA